MYFETDGAYNELAYIVHQENKEIPPSTDEEIRALFARYNIPLGFNKGLIAYFIDVFEKEKTNDKLKREIVTLSNVLYNVTFDKKYIIYRDIIDKEFEIEFKIPQGWKIIDKSNYKKLGFPENIKYVISTTNRNYMVINKIGKCNKEDSEVYCQNRITRGKNDGVKLLYEKFIKDEQEYESI